MQKLLIIDTNGLAHRAYHAFPKDLSTSKGELTNAVYGFSSLLLQSLKLFKPDYIICAQDSPGKTFRHKLYEKYKATRPKMDQELADQIPKISGIIESFNIPRIAVPGYEADDIIGYLANAKDLSKYEIIVVTGDRDLLQLVNDRVKVYLTGGAFSASVLYDKAKSFSKLGFDPKYLVDFKALRGDPSDNIPGIRGIGDKTAQDLISRYQTLDNVYKHVEELKERHKKLLSEQKDIAYLSRELAQINIDLKDKVGLNLDDSEYRDIDFNKAREAFEKYEFRSLITKLESVRKGREVSNGPVVQEERTQPLETFSVTQENTLNVGIYKLLPKDNKFNIYEIKTEKDLEHFISKISASKICSISASRINNNIFSKPESLYFAIPGTVYKVPCFILTLSWIHKLEAALYKLDACIAYDSKEILHMLINLGFGFLSSAGQVSSRNTGNPINWDLNLMAYLIERGRRQGSLQDTLLRHLNIQIEQQNQIDLFNDKTNYTQTHLLLLLFGALLSRLDQGIRVNENADLTSIYTNIELPLVPVLVKMERKGIMVDSKSLLRFSKELSSMINKLQKEIYDLAETEFNISSPKQLGDVLLNKLKVPISKKTKGGQLSTNERVLRDNVDKHPVIRKVLVFRELFKLQSTYTNALIDQINPETHRIHTTFKQAIVATGRLSSINPNLQNIPTSTELGQEIRKVFTAGKGCLLVGFDYAQQELRLLAHLSGDEALKEVFNLGKDIHIATAMKIFNLPEEQVTKKERRVGKTVNFGVLYGMSPFGLATSLEIPVDEARDFIETFFASYPKVQEFFDKVKQTAARVGFIKNLYGREKDAGGLNSPNFPIRNRTMREIINFPLQAGAADIMKQAMIRVDSMMQEKYKDFAAFVLQVHDELIFEVNTIDRKSKQLKQFIEDVTQAMVIDKKISVPMIVQVNIGKNWAELK